jgi:hypothetical protein
MDGWRVAVKPWPRERRRGPRVYASLNKRGEIALSAEAFRQIKEPWNVALYYDPMIGVKYPVPLDYYFYRVRHYGRGGRMRVVSALRLLKQFDIKIEQTLIFYDPPLMPFNGEPMILLELDRAEVRRRSPTGPN